jgi:uncharacterized protein (TIGR00288 family)
LRRNDDVHRIALLMDFENIVLGLPSAKKFNAKAIVSRVLDMGKVVVKKAYADWGRWDKNKIALHELGFDLLEIPRRAMTGKNSADIRMVVDALEIVISKEHIDTFALVTGDSDFTPLVSKLRELDKRVIGLGVKSASSKLLIESCDEFIFYDELEAQNKGLKEQLAKSQKVKAGSTSTDTDRRRVEAFYLILDATRGLMHQYDTLWASMVKQTIMRKHPSFSEGYHGYATFSKLIADAVKHNVIEATLDPKSGNYRITGVGDKFS